jgi:hypothetical protein
LAGFTASFTSITNPAPTPVYARRPETLYIKLCLDSKDRPVSVVGRAARTSRKFERYICITSTK